MSEVRIGENYYKTDDIAKLTETDITVTLRGRRFTLKDNTGTNRELIYNDLLDGVLRTQLPSNESDALLPKLVTLQTSGYKDFDKFNIFERIIISIRHLWGKFWQKDLVAQANLCVGSKDDLITALTQKNPKLGVLLLPLKTTISPSQGEALFSAIDEHLQSHLEDLPLWNALYAKSLGQEEAGVFLIGKERLPVQLAQASSQTLFAGIGDVKQIAKEIPVEIPLICNLKFTDKHIHDFVALLKNPWNKTRILNAENAFHLYALVHNFEVKFLDNRCKEFIKKANFPLSYIQETYHQLNFSAPKMSNEPDFSPLHWMLSICVQKLLPEEPHELLKYEFEGKPKEHPFLIQFLLYKIKGFIEHEDPDNGLNYFTSDPFFTLRKAELEALGDTTLTDEMLQKAFSPFNAYRLIPTVTKLIESGLKESDPIYETIFETYAKKTSIHNDDQTNKLIQIAQTKGLWKFSNALRLCSMNN